MHIYICNVYMQVYTYIHTHRKCMYHTHTHTHTGFPLLLGCISALVCACCFKKPQSDKPSDKVHVDQKPEPEAGQGVSADIGTRLRV